MAKELDQSRPYGEIRGRYHARYTQDGYEFDAAGRQVGGEPKQEKQGTPLDKLSPQKLKSMVEEKGGEYKGKINALKFLSNDVP